MKKTQSLLSIIAGIDPTTVTIPGAEKLRKGWVSVDKMDDNLKRIFGAYDTSTGRFNAISKLIKEKVAAHKKKHQNSEICDGDCDKHHTEMKELRKQRKIAGQEQEQFNRLFWSSLRLEFPELLDKVSVTITEDFQIAYDEEAQKAEASMASMEEIGSLDELAGLLEIFETFGSGIPLRFRR